ncbi:uncharacterized protein LOC122472239 [Prionailurus bengalensis]|uniref:uncharacterized protein LOC122472239 n=1 Tax=Prionailurus bengalensis TaxID=37029 RepID=UPI001CA7C29B|nr:uncharacterized protein LOC122472239 [Prionailurus bengalensis]
MGLERTKSPFCGIKVLWVMRGRNWWREAFCPRGRCGTPRSNGVARVRIRHSCPVIVITITIVSQEGSSPKHWFHSFKNKLFQSADVPRPGMLKHALRVCLVKCHAEWSLRPSLLCAPCPRPSEQGSASRDVTAAGTKCTAANIVVSPNAPTVQTDDRKRSSQDREEVRICRRRHSTRRLIQCTFVGGLFTGTYHESWHFVAGRSMEISLLCSD